MSTDGRVILVIGAHPADCTDLAGGTAHLHAIIQDEVHFLVLTDGLNSHTSIQGMTQDDKRREVVQSAVALRVEESRCHFFGLQDEPLVGNAEVIRSLASFIRLLKPDTVLTHHPNEYAHWDHHECGEIVCRALKAAIKLPSQFGEPHYVPNLLFFAVQFRPEVSRVGVVPQPPDVLVNLPYSVVSAKVKAMQCFVSQGHNDNNKMWKRMYSFESEMGRADGLEYSEGFILGQPLKGITLPRNMDISFYTKEEEQRC